MNYVDASGALIAIGHGRETAQVVRRPPGQADSDPDGIGLLLDALRVRVPVLKP